MAVKIRLKRMGMKKHPFYRIVVADVRSPRDGRFIEELGYYDPMKEPVVLKIDSEKVEKWLKNGAQPTDTVKALISKNAAAKGDVETARKYATVVTALFADEELCAEAKKILDEHPEAAK